MTDLRQVMSDGFDDELEKFAFLDRLRERVFGKRPRENEPTPVLEDKNKAKGAFGRLGDFMRGYMGSTTWQKRQHGMGMYAGPHSEDAQVAALDSVIDRIGGFPLDLEIKPTGSSGYFPDENLVELTQGQLGSAYHEGGHVAGIEGMSPALRDVYLDAVMASTKYGPKSGLALLPNALLDPPGRRRKLSKWGPVAALAPSLPLLFEEGRANVIGGLAAKERGDLGKFMEYALPSYGGYVAQAGAVPLGLWLIHKAKEKRLAEAQEERRAEVENDLASGDLPKAAHVAYGFADEFEKLGGVKSLLGAGLLGALVAKQGPTAIKKQIMSGAQSFDHGRPPRFGGGHIVSQRSDFPLLEKIRFNPIAGAIGSGLKSGAESVAAGAKVIKQNAPEAGRRAQKALSTAKSHWMGP